MMAINANSYGSVAEVVPYTRIYLKGNATFTTDTRPTMTEVETAIDRASGVLNTALANEGLSTPVSQADAKRACDQWVVEQVVKMVAAYGAQPEEMAYWLSSMYENAAAFVTDNVTGFKNLGVTAQDESSAALTFTGETVQADRADPDDTSIEQPSFTRRQFDA